MNTVIFTFRTFPQINKAKTLFPNIIVLGKLKQDLQKVYKLILETTPTYVLGFAKSNKSAFEPIAINNFHKKSINLDGKDQLTLTIPQTNNSTFSVSTNPTNSFCNYNMYHIQQFLIQQNLNIPFMFAHVREEALEELLQIIKEFLP